MGLFDDIANVVTGGAWGMLTGSGGGGGLPGFPSSFDLNINKVANIDPITVNPLSVTQVKDVEINQVQQIAPIAAHIKEINNIDPVSVDAFNVTEVRNIEPLRVEEFNITNLPNVNISLRQMPAVEMNVRRLPPVSVGFHQDIHVPSNYVVRMQLLGFEFLRVALSGQSHLMPREKYRREQERTHERSFPQTAVAGNPAIPSLCREAAVTEPDGCGGGANLRSGESAGAAGLKYGAPAMRFSLANRFGQGAPVSNAGH